MGCGNSEVVESVLFSSTVIRLLACSQPFRQVFGDSPETGERDPEVRDTQGPTARERMENERRRRMQMVELASEN